ncbi:hypothetical protein JIN84_08685 [Luteolibacter yonseiensis]|uniref:Uncharacterized protein n=1 Tax=Luteolibacter yonseiensis TaxID=1144680 RepID=A0A934VB15_9BACT|nr:hypothetical protein [Luteolibacter yonseiensis]MBK1815690.1 hypothetical protein [Luteolibacter yonseiensis]
MKTRFTLLLSACLAGVSVHAQDDPTYTNFIRQKQLPSGVEVDVPNLAPSGEQNSPLAINPNGARFELWTTRSSPFASFQLQSIYVGTFVPMAQVVIDSEDPYGKKLDEPGVFTNVSYENSDFATKKEIPVNIPAMVRRTRADRPFKVYLKTEGLLAGATDPPASKTVSFLRHVQSYGAGGTGANLNRTQASLFSQVALSQNGVLNPLVYTLTSVPGADRAKVRGEERFSVFSIRDEQIAGQVIEPSQLASQYIQVWPVADGSISGITANQIVRFSMPTVTFTYNDTYPGSSTYAQVYKGEVRLNAEGRIVPGSHKNNTAQVPESYVEVTGTDFDSIFDGDGRWTMEVLTVTPFGIDRLGYVSFTLDRTIEVNGSFNTIE